jgi:hypothetical protein
VSHRAGEPEVESPLKRPRVVQDEVQPFVRVAGRPGKRKAGVLGDKLKESEMVEARRKGQTVDIIEMSGKRRRGLGGGVEYEVLVRGEKNTEWMDGDDLLGPDLKRWKQAIDKKSEQGHQEAGPQSFTGEQESEAGYSDRKSEERSSTGDQPVGSPSDVDSEATESDTPPLERSTKGVRAGAKGKDEEYRVPLEPSEGGRKAPATASRDFVDFTKATTESPVLQRCVGSKPVRTICEGSESVEITHRNLQELQYR